MLEINEKQCVTSLEYHNYFNTETVHKEIIGVLKKHNLNIGDAENVLRDIQIVLKKIKVTDVLDAR